MVLLVLLCLLSGVVSVVMFTEYCPSMLLCLLSYEQYIVLLVYTKGCSSMLCLLNTFHSGVNHLFKSNDVRSIKCM